MPSSDALACPPQTWLTQMKGLEERKKKNIKNIQLFEVKCLRKIRTGPRSLCEGAGDVKKGALKGQQVR